MRSVIPDSAGLFDSVKSLVKKANLLGIVEVLKSWRLGDVHLGVY